MKVLVTGASGFVGGHVVEALSRRGHAVRGLVRATSDRSHLETTDASIVVGDVSDPQSLASACDGMDCVVHTAAVVATYGAWEHYRRVGVAGTQNVVDAAVAAGVQRLVHLGSIAVYGFPRRPGMRFHEGLPLESDPEPWNHYVREKSLSEKVVWRAHDTGRIAVTSLRPSVILGARDRNVVNRAMTILKMRTSGLIGFGNNRVPCVVIDELTEAICVASESETAVGKAYNLSGRDPITQKEIMKAFSEAAGYRMMPFRVPFGVAMPATGLVEALYQLAGIEREPPMPRISVAIFGLDVLVDSSLAERDLGWRGNGDYVAAIRESVRWYLGQR